ncbi:hypothetical protein [Oerskovia sp. Root22]|uniref:hypothetical protein n=1 Tax=Oerskovia sp. Root22 TaxID=1736494 RepID=UPI0007014CB4|nr:hypothetical protein [Oerskovia sp. Root22]KRC36941.1 hypothetical protein ASE15_07855 [Oerskovia sp. Root22]
MSATDHRSSNHDDELSRALRDLVDDASLPGLDTHLDVVRGRTRRRRAAKKVALGATTLCVAGALGVAAIALPQDVRPEPIAPAESPSPTPSVSPEPIPTFPAGIDAAALACLQPAPTSTGDDLPAHLSVGVPDLTVQTAGSVTAPVLLRFDGDARLRYADSATGAYVITRDGVIVSSPLPAPETTGEATPAPGSSAAWELDLASSASCDPTSTQPSPLPAGDYEVFALHRFPLTGYSALQADGTWGEETTGALFDGWLVADPVPLTIAPEPDPVVPAQKPVVVRDAIEADTSAVFEALRKAATTGAPAAVDLFFENRLTDSPGGGLMLTVDPNPGVNGSPGTTSDAGWSMAFFGGGVFPDQVESHQFVRLVGTFDVTLDESGATPTFTLDVVAGGTPSTAPAATDPHVCRAFNESLEGDGGVYDSFLADARTLVADRSPAATSQVYREVRARWIESPRVWWALLAHELTMQTTDVGGDQIVGACVEYWQ